MKTTINHALILISYFGLLAISLAEEEKTSTAAPKMVEALSQQSVSLKAETTVGKAKDLDEAAIRNHVRTLCAWSQGSKYYAYFNWLPTNFDPFDALAEKIDDIKSTRHYKYDPWSLGEKKYGITFTVPDVPIIQSLPESRGVFVNLDGIGGAVPIKAAQVFANGFTNGLVARLTVENIMSATRPVARQNEKSPLKIVNDSPIFGASMLDMQVESQFGSGRAAFTDPAAYSEVKSIVEFDQAVEKLLISNDLTAYGMAWGWKAGSEMIAEKAAGNSSVYDAAMALIKNRFTIRKVGVISSYTLSYLSGFSYGQALKADLTIKGKDLGFAAAEVSRSGTEFDQEVKAVLTEIGNWLLSGMEVSFTSGDVTEQDRAGVIEFLLGWHQGLSNATCDIYKSVYNLSFTLGYEKGYKQGYDAGFQAGYQDTYQAAYDSAFGQFASQISELQSDINKAKKESQYWSWGGSAVGAGIGLAVKAFTGGLF